MFLWIVWAIIEQKITNPIQSKKTKIYATQEYESYPTTWHSIEYWMLFMQIFQGLITVEIPNKMETSLSLYYHSNKGTDNSNFMI